MTNGDLHDVEQYIKQDVLAELDGDLTERQLTTLVAASISPFEDTETVPADLVFVDERLSASRFHTLCGLLNALLDSEIDIDALRTTADEIVLEYSTDAQTATARGDEMTRIVGCYMALFDDRRDLPYQEPRHDLHAFGHEPERLLSWHLDHDLIERAVAGEIDGVGLQERVIDTIEGYD